MIDRSLRLDSTSADAWMARATNFDFTSEQRRMAYRKALDIEPRNAENHHIYGIDLVHMGNGEYAVLEDNLRVPSGIAYQMKALQIGAECVPEFRGEYSVLPFAVGVCTNETCRAWFYLENCHSCMAPIIEGRYICRLCGP